jgi:hypothetical protein
MIDYSPSSETKDTTWVRLWGKRHRIDHCHFHGKTNVGMMLLMSRNEFDEPNNHRIDHNLFEDRPDLPGWPDTIALGNGGYFAKTDSETVFEFNYVRNIRSFYESITIKSSGNTIRYNVLDGNRGVLSLRQGARNLVHGNYIFGRGISKTGGIRVQGQEHMIVSNYIEGINPANVSQLSAILLNSGNTDYRDSGPPGSQPYYHQEAAEDVLVANNTIIDAGGGINIGYGGSVAPINNNLVNNVIDGGQDAAIQGSIDSSNSFENNLVWGRSLGVNDPGVRSMDPRLSPDGAGIKRPSASSPVIDAAVAIPITVPDMDGQMRGSLAEIGADEVLSGQEPRGPIAVCGVGPRTYRIGLPLTCDGGVASTTAPNPPTLLSL